LNNVMGFKKLDAVYTEGGVEINRVKTDFDMAKNLNRGNLLTYKQVWNGRRVAQDLKRVPGI